MSCPFLDDFIVCSSAGLIMQENSNQVAACACARTTLSQQAWEEA